MDDGVIHSADHKNSLELIRFYDLENGDWYRSKFKALIIPGELL